MAECAHLWEITNQGIPGTKGKGEGTFAGTWYKCQVYMTLKVTPPFPTLSLTYGVTRSVVLDLVDCDFFLLEVFVVVVVFK